LRLPEAFNDFHEKITLSALSEDRINSAWGRLHGFLTESFALPIEHVYIQGSYANDTAVKPADNDGEYDLDLVCMSAELTASPSEAIDRLTQAFNGDGDLSTRLEPNESGRPCVRLRYADDAEGFGFHVDVVPAKGPAPEGILEVPMRGHAGWRYSAPYRYTEWCQQEGQQFLRVVRFLKRWRDVHGVGSIASIVLQVLSAEHLEQYATSDAEAVTGTLIGIRDFLGTSPHAPPVIKNPVLDTENLADRWEVEDYRQFRGELDEAVELVEIALNEAHEQTAHDHWRKLFGEDFPATPADVKAARIAVPPPPPDYRDERQRAPTDERYG
jgi:Second Messenger Oligonucleotide or Dinucleotide Synthetase domain